MLIEKKNTKRFSYSVLMTSLIFVARKQRVKQKIIVIVKELAKKFAISIIKICILSADII